MIPSARALLLLAVALLAVLGGSPARAEGTTVLPPDVPAPPAVDLSGVPASASIRQDGPDGKPHQVHARLLADRAAVQPGGTFRLGVHLTQDKGWHTYWKSPGAVGKPTEITWQGPEGATFAPYQYPAPAFFELSGIVSYGYDDQVLLWSEVTLPADLPLGEATFGATAQARWLVCEVQCIPGEAELKLTIPVVAAGEPAPPTAWAPLFDHFGATHPQDPATVTDFAVQGAFSVTAVRPGDEFKAALLFTPTGDQPLEIRRDHAAWPFFTPIVTPGWMAMGDPVVQELEGGALRITIDGIALEPVDGVDAFGGLFQVKVGDRWVRTEIRQPMTVAAADAVVAANPSPLFDEAALAAAAKGQADPSAATAAIDPLAGSPAPPAAGLLPMLGLAFLGGMLLNIMPCVLPVLTLKLYSLVEQADISAGQRRRAGLAYTAGIVLSFVLLALAVVVLKSAFDLNLGWGFQFQYPGYVIALATIVFVFALNLFGVFEVPVFGANQMSEASDKEGLVGYFMTGAFATLLATPCSAPFLGTGMGFAFTLPAWGITLFFAVAGLGLAFPFLVIAFVPALFRFMPRPGAWMETFKQFMGFTLIATTVWLADVVASQTGREGATGLLIFLSAVALGAWIFGRFGGVTASGRRQAGALAVAVVIAAFTGRNVLKTTLAADDCAPAELAATDAAAMDWSEDIPWQPFSDQAVASLDGKLVFIDFTADWCLTCKVNEKNILDTDGVRQAMAQAGVVPLKADWTRRDETITAWLQRFGKAGVPFYLVIPADRSRAPIPLPEVITPDIVKQALKDAS
ncbi:thioredoxin family protein [Myxococcota bacterium]|nr:thioredoxin family protein [Myxococcota bacterium]